MITPNAGLRPPETRGDARRRSQAFAGADVHPDNAAYRRPLEQSARALAGELGADCDVVLLGSIASPKYVDVLLAIFGDRLLFPARVRRPRRHEPRRPAAAQAARRRRTRLRAGCRRGPARRTAAEAPAAQGPSTIAHDMRRRSLPSTTRTTSSSTVERTGGPADQPRASCSGRSSGLTKGDLLQYYADVADVLLPHIRDRAMVMKRYPHGAAGEFFFMKRAPTPRPPMDSRPARSTTAPATSSTSR